MAVDIKTYPVADIGKDNVDYTGTPQLHEILSAIQNETNITIACQGINGDGTNINITFNDTLPADQKTNYLDLIIYNHDGIDTTKKPEYVVDNEGHMEVSINPKKLGAKKTFYSHDFTDCKTWTTSSERVIGETLSTSDDLTYTLGTPGPVIDVTHFRITSEVYLRKAYRPVVYSDGVAMVEDIYRGANTSAIQKDYTIDYTTGAVTFHVAQTGKTVTMDYSKPGASNPLEDIPSVETADNPQSLAGVNYKSLWKVIPEAGKEIIVDFGETAYSNTISFSDSMVFLPVINHPVNGYLGLWDRVFVFNNQWDFKNESNGFYQSVGTAHPTPDNARDLIGDINIDKFKYQATEFDMVLKSSQYMELWIFLLNDTEIAKQNATDRAYSTLYCIEQDEIT
jgi:hypothetical protein